MSVRVEGLEKVLNNLNREVAKMKTGSKQGLIRAGFLIQRGSMQKAPVDTSNLKNSHYTAWGEGKQDNPAFNDQGVSGRKLTGAELAEIARNHETTTQVAQSKTKGKLQVAVGASAAYALFVHEDMAANHPNGGQAKFLQASVEENYERILDVMAGKAKENIAK